MRRAGALVLLLAVTAPRVLPLIPVLARPPAPRATGASQAHHHPPGCPWQGTSECPHAHHGPSSLPAWTPCVELPLPAVGEAKLAWAPPGALVAGIRVPAPSALDARARVSRRPSAAPLDIDLPPPKPVRSA